ncbi:MAG: hypothetical protein U9R07_02565 [Pseudomonadota bacterium]|nr:hypothetical protein [Pseudomonadota bacterium]
MAQFDQKSRYVLYAGTRFGTDRRGRTVVWVTPARVPDQVELGLHRRKAGHRLDRLAAHYLDDPMGGWRISAINDAINPDAIADLPLIRIPVKAR